MRFLILAVAVAVAALGAAFALGGLLVDVLLVIGLVAAGACVVPWQRILVHRAEDAPAEPDPWLT